MCKIVENDTQLGKLCCCLKRRCWSTWKAKYVKLTVRSEGRRRKQRARADYWLKGRIKAVRSFRDTVCVVWTGPSGACGTMMEILHSLKTSPLIFSSSSPWISCNIPPVCIWMGAYYFCRPNLFYDSVCCVRESVSGKSGIIFRSIQCGWFCSQVAAPHQTWQFTYQ